MEEDEENSRGNDGERDEMTRSYRNFGVYVCIKPTGDTVMTVIK